VSADAWVVAGVLDVPGLLERLHGPYNLRFVLQPSIAAIAAVRAALRDVRSGRPPYLWKVATRPEHRAALLREGWRDVRVTFALAALVDVLYQRSTQGWIDPVAVLLAALLLAVVPYLLLRGPVARVVRAITPPPPHAPA
jgi:hypothetical protein